MTDGSTAADREFDLPRIERAVRGAFRDNGTRAEALSLIYGRG
jgi:hypothetical protein